jgi:hypothetical protein
MAISYYIYYRVEAAKGNACASRVRELFAAVRKTTGVSGRLLKKRGEPLLWMEIYDNVGDEARFEWELAEAVARLQFQECLQAASARHTECFTE